MLQLQLTAISNSDGLLGGTTLASLRFEVFQEALFILNESSKNDMLSIEPVARNESEEELRAIGVLTSIGHGQETRDIVLVLEVFIFELVTVDGFTTSTVALGEITALSHEFGDDSVESAALVSEAATLFTSAEASEVFSSLGDSISKEFKDESADLIRSDGKIKEDLRVFSSHFDKFVLSF